MPENAIIIPLSNVVITNQSYGKLLHLFSFKTPNK